MAEEIRNEASAEAEEAGQPAAAEAEAQAPETDVAEQTESAPEQPDEKEELQKEIESLKKELADEKEKYLRLDAEYYNYRTRSLKEKQDAYDNAQIKAVTEILGVIDNFERALTAECADANFKRALR